ncbi:MAG: hypothetical protein KC587_10015 [Nitrospira sp.]|nr:hypothetical protein [Nitrospira sp.]
MEATIAVQSELIVEKELQSLKKYAENKGFEIFNLNSLTFVAKNLCAKGGDRYSLIVECDDYPNLPPIFRWCNGETLEFEGIKDVPKGDGGYFHSSRTPCAPWNRNSYKQFQGNGPHGDWQMVGWQNNPKTGQCTTIPRMILKMCAELQSERYKGRSG